ncbi:MAG: hypothetical protein PVI41_12495, partial [Roseobacter sp.]
MAVYFIPTGYAGGTILVNDGDVFIFEAGASTNIAFESASSLPADFAMDFSESKISAFTVEIKNDLNADITIADDVSLDNPCIKASNAASTDLTIGNNVTLDRFEGSGGTDTVTIGDNFVTKNDFKTGNGDDAIIIDNNATAPKFDAG